MIHFQFKEDTALIDKIMNVETYYTFEQINVLNYFKQKCRQFNDLHF